MRILVTGPGGFLGSALVNYWNDRGHELLLLARESSRLDRVENLSSTNILVARVSSQEEITALVRDAKPAAIVHTACCYGRSGESLLEVMDTNLRLGITLLQTITDQKASEVKQPILFINTGTVLNPRLSLYSLSKHQFSSWAETIARSSPLQLQYIDIRLQHMYGPGDDGVKFVPQVVNVLRNGLSSFALTNGEQVRDFIYIDDVVNAFDCILKRREQFSSSDAIDVGTGDAVSIRTFIELAKRIARVETKLDFGAIPYRENESMLSVANTERLRSLGWAPKVKLTEGLKKTFNLSEEY
jgi:CDP-paratose synthetase